jgi:hypothetical protein
MSVAQHITCSVWNHNGKEWTLVLLLITTSQSSTGVKWQINFLFVIKNHSLYFSIAYILQFWNPITAFTVTILRMDFILKPDEPPQQRPSSDSSQLFMSWIIRLRFVLGWNFLNKTQVLTLFCVLCRICLRDTLSISQFKVLSTEDIKLAQKIQRANISAL